MPDRLSSLLTRFGAVASVDRTGALREVDSFDPVHDVGRLHLLRSGAAQALHPGWTPLKLVRPSLLFYPRPFAHRLAPTGGTAVNLISAAIRFDGGSVNPLAAALPPLLALPLEALNEARTTLEQLFDEADGARCGHRIALDRLCDLLLVQVLRHVIDRALASSGMLAGLADARLSRALIVLHEQPQHDWHLETLAARAGMSRARFAARFKQVVGIAPGEYLTRWRISLAQHLLQQGRPVKEVAGEVGYASPAALGRVFATRTGTTPKAWATHRSPVVAVEAA
ncbi:MAG: helix-turn-helix transcriptional regulator [Burkholderiaceae bacterium]|nr:helix-turn-helix transcriptional regulator [Burkholderiaceae bacterium]